jgi:hypothetical protein
MLARETARCRGDQILFSSVAEPRRRPGPHAKAMTVHTQISVTSGLARAAARFTPSPEAGVWRTLAGSHRGCDRAIGPLLAHNVDAMSATRTATAAADAQCLTRGPQQRCRQAYRDRLSISF